MIAPLLVNPLHTLSRYFVLNMIQRIAPQTILQSVTLLVSTIYTILPSFGFFRSFQLLLRIREALNMRAVPKVLKDILFRGTNPIAAETIFNVLEPNWKSFLNNIPSFRRIINILFFVFCGVIILQPFTLWLIRISIMAILSAIGILYTPALKALKFFRKYSMYVLAFLPFDIVPKGVRSALSPINDIINEPIADSKTKKVGIGILVALSMILLWDHFKPDTPGISIIADYTKSSINYIFYCSQVITVSALSPFLALYEGFLDPLLPARFRMVNMVDSIANFFNRNNTLFETRDMRRADLNRAAENAPEAHLPPYAPLPPMAPPAPPAPPVPPQSHVQPTTSLPPVAPPVAPPVYTREQHLEAIQNASTKGLKPASERVIPEAGPSRKG